MLCERRNRVLHPLCCAKIYSLAIIEKHYYIVLGRTLLQEGDLGRKAEKNVLILQITFISVDIHVTKGCWMLLVLF